MNLRFSVLGALRVHPDHGPPVALKPSRPATLLAALLLHPNEVVPPEYLDAVTWGSYVPRTARASLHTYISRLRQMLCREGLDATAVETVPGGYRIRIGPGELDLLRFRELVDMAQLCDVEADERALLSAALGLFSADELLVNVSSPKLRADLAQLVGENWRHTAERCFDLRIASDHPSSVRPDLRAAMRAHPDHPRFGEQLVEVLWREGDTGEALRMFAQVRAHYRDVLGSQPPARFLALGEELRRSGPTRPANGPESERRSDERGAELIGRGPQIAEIAERLSGARSAVMLTGLPGTGKTVLAVHAARLLDPGFRADTGVIALREPSGAGRCPDEVADIVIASLRLRREPMPVVVLDDAVSVEQVAPLLRVVPGRVVVTSRCSLPELAVSGDVSVVRLGALDREDGHRLLQEVLGRHRIEAEPAAAAELAEWCGLLPLPLRFAAVRLALRPHQSIAEYLAALRADPVGKLSAGAGRELSYAQRAEAFLDRLTPPVLDAFRVLAEQDSAELTETACLAALRDGSAPAEQVLEQLNEWNLVEEIGSGVFRVDVLMRSFVLARVRHAAAVGHRDAATVADPLPDMTAELAPDVLSDGSPSDAPVVADVTAWA